MKRTTSKLLIPIALVGAAATGFLVVMFMGDEPVRVRKPELAGPGDGRAGDATRAGGTDTVAGGLPGHSRTGGPNSVHAGKREPSDSPMTRQERMKAQNKVEALLQEIMLAEDVTRRIKIQKELVALMRSLGRNIDPVMRDRLIAMIDSVEPTWRRMVGLALGQLRGDEVVATALLDKLTARPENYYTRQAIYEALMNLNVRTVVPRLVAMLGDGHEDEQRLVAAIGHLGGPNEAAMLLERLGQPLRAQTRFEIERVLKTKVGITGFMDKVVDKLEEADVDTRRSLLKVLERSRNPEHSEAVRDLLKNETDPQVRRAAITVLGSFGDPESGKALLEIVATGDARERKLAANAIGNIRNSDTVATLAEKYSELDQEAQWAIIRAGSRVPQPSDKLFEIARDEGIRDDRMNIRVASATLLGKPGKDKNVEALVGFLQGAKHPSEWTQGLRALERIGTKKAAEQGLSSLHVVHNRQQREHWMSRFEKVLDKHRRTEELKDATTRGGR